MHYLTKRVLRKRPIRQRLSDEYKVARADRDKLIVKLYKSGLTTREIAGRRGIRLAKQSVAKILHAAGVTMRPKGTRSITYKGGKQFRTKRARQQFEREQSGVAAPYPKIDPSIWDDDADSNAPAFGLGDRDPGRTPTETSVDAKLRRAAHMALNSSNFAARKIRDLITLLGG